MHAYRYCGLLEASLAAHEHAQRLDPKIPTSVIHTHWHLGEYGRVADCEFERNPTVVAMAWLMLNRPPDAIDALAALRKTTGRMNHFFTAVRAAAQGQRDETVVAVGRVASGIGDPEGLFYLTQLNAHVGDVEGALALFERVVAGGFSCFPSFASDSWLDGLRAHAEFRRVLSLAEVSHRKAVAAFREAGGERVLGITLSWASVPPLTRAAGVALGEVPSVGFNVWPVVWCSAERHNQPDVARRRPRAPASSVPQGRACPTPVAVECWMFQPGRTL